VHAGFDLTLVHTADTYSALSAIDAFSGSCQPTNTTYVTGSGEAACFGGVARMKTVIDEQRARSANVLVVDAGNIISTSLYYYVSGPSLVASYYVQLGYDLVHLQVQDFVLPLENVIQFVHDTKAGAPALSFVVSNLEGYNSDTRANGTYIAKWAFKTFAGGERVGFAATVANNLASMVRTPLEIRATEEAAALSVAVMALINKGANKIVASVSSNATAQVILASVPGIDILIVPTQLQANDLSGIRSSAVAPYPLVYNTSWEQPVLVVSSGTYGRLIGVLDVVFDDNGVITSWSGDAVLMDESVTPDAAIQTQLLANYAQLQSNFSQIVGWSSIDLGFETNCLFAECAIGGWLGDAVRSFAARTWGGNVQVALNNGGSMRGTFARGPITLGQEQTAFPFATNSDLYTFQLEGRYLLAALENGLSLATDPSSDINNGAGRFLQVSGVRYSWNPSEEVGYRVVDVKVEVTPGVWDVLDVSAVYNVSTFDWMVIYGGDDYTMLRDNSTRLLKNGDNMMAVLLDALAKNITSVDVNRITVVSVSRRACLAPDGSVCNNNGDCIGGECHCTVAGTVSDRLCAVNNSTAAASDSSNSSLAIALGVSLPVAALVLLVVLVILIITRLRRRREHNSWEIDMAELEMGSQLGAGGFGEVHRAVWKGTDVAVKVVSAHNTGKAAWDNFKQEVSVMTALRHPNVVLFMAASTKPPKMCIVMELMELGSLYDVRVSASC
jgi:5'-nucleotidase